MLYTVYTHIPSPAKWQTRKLFMLSEIGGKDKRNFDEAELVSGSSDLFNKTDADLCSDEIGEDTPGEGRKKIIDNN